MDIFDRIASEFVKEARLPSHKDNPKDVVEKAWEEHKEKHPEMAKFEGALNPETGEISEDRIEENEKEMGKTANVIIDDIGLGRVASSHSSLIRKVEREIEKLTDTPFDIELKSEYYGTYIVIMWDRSLVYDKRDEDEIGSYEYIEQESLIYVLNKIFQFVEENHDGLVEIGRSAISEGIYRIRIH